MLTLSQILLSTVTLRTDDGNQMTWRHSGKPWQLRKNLTYQTHTYTIMCYLPRKLKWSLYYIISNRQMQESNCGVKDSQVVNDSMWEYCSRKYAKDTLLHLSIWPKTATKDILWQAG